MNGRRNLTITPSWPKRYHSKNVRVYDRIVSTRTSTLAGIFAKLEWGEGDAEVTEAIIADLRRWLTPQS
jgi:hypothetical protein